MSDIGFMHSIDLARSTPFRFALAITAVFVLAYVAVGILAFRALNANLDDRVAQGVELTASGFADHFGRGDRGVFVAAIDARTASEDPDDVLFWLGTLGGRRLAGTNLVSPLSLVSGDARGEGLMPGLDDNYRVAVRDVGELRLIVAASYEDAEEVSAAVLRTFVRATVLVVILACGVAAVFAWRGQRRIDAIAATLRAVSEGDMAARVPVTGGMGDIDRLSAGINSALMQLETTVAGIRQISTDIAHDLRTPINRLGILLERIRRAAIDSSELQEPLQLAERELSGIVETFDALLRIARIEAGARNAHFEAIALDELAASLYETYVPIAEGAGQILDFHASPAGDSQVVGERKLLTQLLVNLIENAIRHCPPGTAIKIVIDTDPHKVSMSVTDNGPGIPDAEMDEVLRRFYRLEKSRHEPGSGLGLAMVKAISDLHGAELQLENAMPGLAATVVFKRQPGDWKSAETFS